MISCWRFLVEDFLAAMAIMPREVKVKTLESGCGHRSSHADKYHQRIEGNASWKERLWRSHWTTNPQSNGPGRRIVSRWWSDPGVRRAVACRIGSGRSYTVETKLKLQQQKQSMQRASSRSTSRPRSRKFLPMPSGSASRWSQWQSLSLWRSLGIMPFKSAIL